MASLVIRPRADVDRTAWDAVADASASAWIWHTGAVIDALSVWPRHADRSFAVADEKGALLAIVPVHRIADRMMGFIDAARLTSIGGPAIRDDVPDRLRRETVETIVAAIDAALAADSASWIEAIVSPMTPVVQASPLAPNPLVEFGFADCSQVTWVVDLQRDEAGIRAGYSQLTRRQLRKAADEAFTIRPAQGEADCARYYALHLETCARTGATPLPPQYMEAIFRDLIPRGLVRIMFLERAGEIAAAQSTGQWKGGALYWSGASRDERSGGDNRLLFDAQIMASRQAGCRYYETGQAYPTTTDSKEKGLSDFKASFGAVLARFPHGRRYVGSGKARTLAAIRVARSIARGEHG